MTQRDVTRLKEEIGLTSVIDLRYPAQVERWGVGRLNEVGAKYQNVPLITGVAPEKERTILRHFTDSGDEYFYRIRQREFGRRLVEALEIIAEPGNHPLVFHCNAGKARTGILSAIILSILGVTDEDIIEDYTLTAPNMKAFIDRYKNDPETAEEHNNIPDYMWEVAPESMRLFLSMLKREYGSARGYAQAHGAEVSGGLVRSKILTLLHFNNTLKM